MCFSQDTDLESKVFNLPSYLESLASILREMETLPETYTVSLEHLMVILVENMPSIPQKTHFLCIRALLLVLMALFPKGSSFIQVLSGFGRCKYLEGV